MENLSHHFFSPSNFIIGSARSSLSDCKLESRSRLNNKVNSFRERKNNLSLDIGKINLNIENEEMKNEIM